MAAQRCSVAYSDEVALRVEPTLRTTVDAEGGTELSKMLKYGFDFRLMLAMRELDEMRAENRELRRQLRRRAG